MKSLVRYRRRYARLVVRFRCHTLSVLTVSCSQEACVLALTQVRIMHVNRESYSCLRPLVIHLHWERMMFCVGNAAIIASIYPKLDTSIADWRELVTIKATVPKNKASDGAAKAATDKRRTQVVALC
jgi:hypothetical protein